MRKVIFAINLTINGFADHTIGIVDDELHDFFINLLKDVDVILMGRKTYQLMESFWPDAYKDPRSTESMIRFADKFNPMSKVVFSNTLTEVKWKNSRLASRSPVEVVSELKNQNGKNISAGSLSIATQLLNANLIDEFWFVIHPVAVGKGPRLFDEINAVKNIQLLDFHKLHSGVIALHYQKQ